MRHCDGYTCKTVQAPVIRVHNGEKYKLGWKYCSACERWVVIETFQCPCCKNPLRVKARRTCYIR